MALLAAGCSGGEENSPGPASGGVSNSQSRGIESSPEIQRVSYSPKCSKQGTSGSSVMGDAGESVAAAEGKLFDGGKGLSSLGSRRAETPVLGAGGEKCFSGFTAAARTSGFKTKDVPAASYSFSKTTDRERSALSSIIPGGPVVMEKYLEFQKKAYDHAVRDYLVL